jgi:hypothetical protein
MDEKRRIWIIHPDRLPEKAVMKTLMTVEENIVSLPIASK